MTKAASWNPLLSPDWRAVRATDLADANPVARCLSTDDDFIRQYRMLQIRKRQVGLENALETCFHTNPSLYFADILRSTKQDNTSDVPLMVEARLLAGQTTAEIAQKVKTDASVILWYSKLFFDVQDNLDNSDWIQSQVLLPALRVPRPQADASPMAGAWAAAKPKAQPLFAKHLDFSLKYFAYNGGPLMCDLGIGGMLRVQSVKTEKELRKFLDSAVADLIRLKAAQSALYMEVTKYDVMDLLTVHSKIVETATRVREGSLDEGTGESTVLGMLSEVRITAGRFAAEAVSSDSRRQLELGSVDIDPAELIAIESGSDIVIEDKELYESAFRRGTAGGDTQS